MFVDINRKRMAPLRIWESAGVIFRLSMSKAYDTSVRTRVLSISLLFILALLLGKSRLTWFVITVSFIGTLGYFVLFVTLPSVDPPTPKFLHYNSATLNDNDISEASSVIKREAFFGSPKIFKEIEDIVELILRDFVNSWFSHINANPASDFPRTVRKVLLRCVEKLQIALECKDEASIAVLRILPLINKYLDGFRLAQETVIGDMVVTRNEEMNRELSIAVEFNKNVGLHKALSLRSQCMSHEINQYVKLKVEEFLRSFIDTKELDSPYVYILLREILGSCIVEPIIVKFSDPDVWNLKIISISESILEEYDQVDEIRKILFREVEVQRNPVNNNDMRNEESASSKIDLTPNLSNQQFEEFLRHISGLNSFIDLRSTKYSLLTKLLRLKQSKSRLPKNILEYERRLLLSLNLVQTRLLYESGKSNLKKKRLGDPSRRDAFNVKKEMRRFETFLGTICLEDVLQEDYSISFFEKFLKENSLKNGSVYLEYWKLVEGLKNPLENAITNGSISVTIDDKEFSNLEKRVLEFLSEGNLAIMITLNQKLVTEIVELKGADIQGATRTSGRRKMLLLQDRCREALNRRFFPRYKESNFFLEMISCPEFSSTDMYARLMDFPTNVRVETVHRTKGSVDAARILTHPDINDALNRISSDKSSFRRSSSRHVTSSETLFGTDDGDGLFNDTLFGNEDSIGAIESIDGHQERVNETDKSLLDSVNSDFCGNPKSSSSELESGAHTFTNLKENIAKLTLSIDDIEKELELLDHLILKAELTNNQNQLKVLRKSQKVLLKELDTKELLKQQCLVQENANSLYGKTKICIKTYYIDTPPGNGREIAYYLVDVEHVHRGQITTWEIPRRFSEFFELHSTLKKKYKHQVKYLQKKDVFPEKVKISLKYHVSKALLYEERTTRLEKYLRALLILPEICQDNLFRVFLTNSMPFNPKEETINKSSPLLRSHHGSATDISAKGESLTDMQIRQIDANYEEELNFYGDDRNFYHNNGADINSRNKSFIKPICDIFISVFSLNRSNSGWLRGKTIITVLQRLLGSTIEKYIKNSIRKLGGEDQILKAIHLLKDLLWGSDGVLTTNRMNLLNGERTIGEKTRTHADSQVIFQSLLAETCGKVVGLRNAKEAALNIHNMLQNQFLMASLLLELLDVVIDEICDDYGRW